MDMCQGICMIDGGKYLVGILEFSRAGVSIDSVTVGAMKR